MEIRIIDNETAKIDDKYIVKRDGRVFTFWKNRGKWAEQKYRQHTNGYVRVTINGKDVYLHRIVAMCFCDNANGYQEVNHIDGNKGNNCADNLEWCTRSQNNKHAFVTGLRDYNELRQMTNSQKAKDARKRRRVVDWETANTIRGIKGKSDREIARMYGISRGSVWEIRNGRSYREP